MESWQGKQLVCTKNITKRTKNQQEIRGQSLPRSVSFRRRQGEREGEEEEDINGSQEEDKSESKIGRDKLRDAMKDLPLIGKQISVREQVQPVVKCQTSNQIEEARNYHYNNELTQQHRSSQYYDSNNNNDNNGFNSSKDKLLITPAARSMPEVCGSKQQMALSNQNAAINLQANYNNNRSQQSRQKNYHQYDYYTDSDLTCSQKETQQLNHYDDEEENILLFATEHDSSSNNNAEKSSTNGNQQRVARVTPESRIHSQPPSQLQVNNSKKSSTSHHQYSRLLYNNAPQTGRFVNYYPSWRQTQSPTSHYKNYSFHVPLHQQQHHYHLRQPVYQARYSFVAPVERTYVTPGGRFKQSFKSQTISHIPNMIKVSVEETTGRQKKTTTSKAATNNNNNSFEDYYVKPHSAGLVNIDDNSDKYFMKSEGDLLKAHVIDLRHDKGYDNPFKPGTELSWEAEMMVRLMKRGYPIQELPVLVETAKHLAKERTKESLFKSNDSSAKERVKSYDDAYDNGDGDDGMINQPRRVMNKNNLPPPTLTTTNKRNKQMQHQKSETSKLRLQSSQSDLSSGKQIWANSLSRTKSMPRFSNYSSNSEYHQDIDSIDKLITSIENDLFSGNGEYDDGKRLINETMGQNGQNISKKVPRGEKLQPDRRINGGSSLSAANMKVNNRGKRLDVRNNDNNNNSPSSRNQQDLNRMNNRKNKKNGKQCCIIQ